MKSLVICADGLVPFLRVYSRETYEQVVILCAETFDHFEEVEGKKLECGGPEFLCRRDSGEVFGPVYALLLVGIEWKSVSGDSIVSALMEHGIVPFQVWVKGFELERGNVIYYYTYYVEEDLSKMGAAEDWVKEDISRHCVQYSPQAMCREEYEREFGQLLFMETRFKTRGTLVKEGDGFKIWLTIKLP